MDMLMIMDINCISVLNKTKIDARLNLIFFNKHQVDLRMAKGKNETYNQFGLASLNCINLIARQCQ